jgi:hypothetical protein
MIRGIMELAAHLGANNDTEKSIARRLFKDTECGVSSGVTDTEFWVSGYCEGSDWEHEVYKIQFPCKEESVDEAISKADKDGCHTWDQTHGCEKCHPEGACDEWGNEFLPEEAGGPVNTNCTHCGGSGVIL